MSLFRRHSVASSLGSALLATMVLCPVMGAVGSTWTTSSCHESESEVDERHAPADPAPILACCAIEDGEIAIQAAPGDRRVAAATHDAIVPSWTAPEWPGTARVPQYAPSHRPRPTGPPLFLQHASLLI
jgi:hypothetical protein